MNWEALGAISELCGAVAVVATLVYLSVQVRQNSRLIEAGLAESHVVAANELPRILASEPGAGDIFWEGLETSRESLETEQQRRFDPMIFLFTSSAYQAFRQGDNAGLARADWILGFVGFREWWTEYQSTYPDDFREYIASKLPLPKRTAE